MPASIFIALVWLLPNHQLPWFSFHHEMAMALVVALMAIVIGWQTRWLVIVPSVAIGILMLALIPFVHYAGGLITKHGLAVTGSLYLFVFFVALVIGCSSHAAKSNVFWRLIFSAIALAALLNVAVQLIQWRGLYDSNFLSFVGFWASWAADSHRPSGNLLQPNQLATLLVWGAISLLWLNYAKQVRWWLTLIALMPLAFGMVLTQSRAGILELLLLLPLAIWVLPPGGRRRTILVISCIALAVIIGVAWMPALMNAWIGEEVFRPRAMGMAQDRLAVFKIFAYALIQSPWVGYGFGNLGSAFLAAAVEHPEWYFGGFALHSHNLFLDYLLWFGLPLGGALVVASVWIFARAVSQARKIEGGFFYLAMVSAVAVHSMVELPHQYLYFLVPSGLFLGYLSKPSIVLNAIAKIHKGVWLAAGSVGLILAFVIAQEYLTVQSRYTEWRFENERIGNRLGKHADDLIILQHFADELALYNTKFDKKIDISTQEWVLDTAVASNSAPAIFDLIVMLALNDRQRDARVWMHRLNAISGPGAWGAVDRLWRKRQVEHPALSGMDWPPLPHRATY